MPNFEPFLVVAVPFVERQAQKNRPAVVISAARVSATYGLVWLAMVTSQDNAAWPSDVPVHDLQRAGLPKPSVVRPAKIATAEVQWCEARGRLDERTIDALVEQLRLLAAWHG